MTVVRTTRCEAETIELATRLGRGLAGGEVICLEGPLGSGKTCFVRGLATGLGLDPSEVCSPTYVIWRRYENHDSIGRYALTQTPLALVHVDAFRLSGPQDLEAVGWEELLEAPDTVIAVEWPSRITEALPVQRIDVVMTHEAESARRISLDAPPEIASTWERPHQ